MRMSGGMVPLPVLPVKAPSPNCCPSPSKPFICHTSAKCAHNSFSCHTSKFTLPQTLCLPHIRDPRGVGNVLVNLPSLMDLRLPHRGSNRVHPAASFQLFNLFQPSEGFLATEDCRPKNRLCYTGT